MAATQPTQPTLLDRVLEETPAQIKDRMRRSQVLPANARAFDLILSELLLNIKELRAMLEILLDKGETVDSDSAVLLARLENEVLAYLKEHLPHGYVPPAGDTRRTL